MDKKRILIVDDQPEILEVIDDLVMDNFEVETVLVENAVNALGRLNKEIFHLILTDFKMPGLSGVDLVKEIRGSNTPNAQCPIIFITAVPEVAIEELGSQNQDIKVFNKLANIQDILKEVEALIQSN